MFIQIFNQSIVIITRRTFCNIYPHFMSLVTKLLSTFSDVSCDITFIHISWCLLWKNVYPHFLMSLVTKLLSTFPAVSCDKTFINISWCLLKLKLLSTFPAVSCDKADIDQIRGADATSVTPHNGLLTYKLSNMWHLKNMRNIFKVTLICRYQIMKWMLDVRRGK